MKISRLLLVVVLSACLTVIVYAQYFPRSGRAAIYQRSLDVQARLNVLAIAMRPGYEDLASLAYLRLGKGAQIAGVFVTNGEAGESDVRGKYPNQLAAERRTEATDALHFLDGGALFLNMPDIVAAHDSGSVRSIWQADTLRSRLMRVISEFRPDVILVERDWLGGVGSPQMQVVEAEVMNAVRLLAPINSSKTSMGSTPGMTWSVGRVLIDDGTNSGARVSVDRIHPIWKKSYRELGVEAGQKYRSIVIQRRMWSMNAFGERAGDKSISYRELTPRRKSLLKQIDENLPGPLPPSMSAIGKEIISLTTATLRGESKIRDAGGKPEDVLVRLVRVMQPLDQALRRVFELSPEERKIGLQWKLNLEDLRVALLGVVVRYTIDETVLTERQIALLQIDTITGMRPRGRSYLYFPTVDEKGWIVNERPQKQLDIELHKPYRLLTPAKLEFHLPAGQFGLQRTGAGSSFPFYVIHEGARPEESFIARVEIPVKFAPRFTTEILTPVVSATPGERIALQLTNNSRDGVRDSVYVDDSLATSAKREFRLNTKGGTHLDTLVLSWKQPLSEGTYSIPVKISGTSVAEFAARRFNVKVDESKHVALFTGIEASPTADALRRLGASWEIFTKAPQDVEDLARAQVAIIDRRALTLEPSLQSSRPVFDRFVQRGGHLIVFAQDAGTWNARPLIEDLLLKQSATITEETAVETDSTNRLLMSPNEIRRDDWANWLFQRAYNVVSGRALEYASIPVRTSGNRAPLLVQWKRGAGTVTYTDLAFHPQFLNVHAGTYRLLANLIAY